MVGLGVACSLVHGHPVVVGVLVEREAAGVRVLDRFDHRSDPQSDFALQLADLSRAFTAWLRPKTIEIIAVRAMDQAPHGLRRDTSVLEKRYGVSGVLLAAGRQLVARAEHLTGRAIADRCSCTKAEADTRGADLADRDSAEAAAAALAAVS